MNFLKKKLKPLTSGFNQAANNSGGQQAGTRAKDLEDDLYDEYVVEAPPHPSELLALGVNPDEIDANDPDKLRELYRKAKEEGKDKKTNSVLLARQRQREEIEEKKRTREEWKFFDSLTSRVEQVVKESQKNLDHWKESSALSELAEPEYELRQTADEVFRPVTTVKLEKGQNEWIDFDEDSKEKGAGEREAEPGAAGAPQGERLDEFGCPVKAGAESSSGPSKASEFVVEELLEDFGLDLRSAEQKRACEERQRNERAEREEAEQARRLELEARERSKRQAQEEAEAAAAASAKIDVKSAARPRPRPRGARAQPEEPKSEGEPTASAHQEIDPFQTSFVTEDLVAPQQAQASAATVADPQPQQDETAAAPKFIDPFDTSYVRL